MTDHEASEVGRTNADIASRNAGEPCISVWKDGSYVHHGARDAEFAFRCEPDAIILTLRLSDLKPLTFLTRDELQQSVAFTEKLLSPLHLEGGL